MHVGLHDDGYGEKLNVRYHGMWNI